MKTIFKSILYLSFAGLVLGGCAKNDDFSYPDVSCNEPNLTVTKNISDFYSISSSENAQQYTGDDVISGIVVSSDEGGNFFRELYIVNEENTFAAKIGADISNSYAKYGVGRKIYIKMKNLYTKIDNGVLNIGGSIYNEKYTGYIEDPAYKSIIFRSCTEIPADKIEKDYNNHIAISDVLSSDTYIGKLVTFDEVQFDSRDVGGTFYDKNNVDAGGYTLRKLVDKEGKSVYIRTGQYSNGLKDLKVSDKSGSVTGIITRFGTSNVVYQFYPRTAQDINLTKDRFGDDSVDPTDPDDPSITVEPGLFLAFPGADFEDWNAFTGALNNFGLTFVTQSNGKGWENSTGLEFKGIPDKTGYAFTVSNVNVPTDATEISFLMKGTAADRSLSINLYRADGEYVGYNLNNISTSKKISRTPHTNKTDFVNDYAGVIDTKDQWVKIILKIEGFDYNKSGQGDFIAFKFGGKTASIQSEYDLVIDEIRFEDGTPVDPTDPVDPDPVDPADPDPSDYLADFNDWSTFIGNLNSFGLQSYATQAVGEGRNGKDALKISGTPNGNDYVFTLENMNTIPSGKTKLIVWVKGTSGKSLSFNVHSDGSTYSPFNAGTITGDTTLSKAGNNQYTGTIDTNGEWVKLTLDLTTMTDVYNTSGNDRIFALKVGKDEPYDLLIDSIYFE